MPRSANPQNLQINPTGSCNHFFVVLAEVIDILFGDLTGRDVNILFGDIDMLEQLSFHESVITLFVLVTDRVVLIQIESDHIFK